ncbi:hypothetical protein FKW77_009812 [Venturia effusa]|uniref:Uncharacterized protein n=1 Tax=Venturia effusa TaxID=50376 RepID=A0A517L262_9PEZI|nr:hypothetical protein FKW77_009812 [Venturia effusa]
MAKYQVGRSLQTLYMKGNAMSSVDVYRDPTPDQEEYLSDPRTFFRRHGGVASNMAFPTYDEINSQVRGYSETIMSSWKHVQEFCLAGGDIIERRWKKKSRKARKSFLLQAFPEMPKEHNPGFRALLEMDRKSPNDFCDQDTILWPFLNLEDLSRPKPLLLLLNSRGRNHPEVFVANDAELLIFGDAIDLLQKIYLPGYEIQLRSRIDERSYAVLEPIHGARISEGLSSDYAGSGHQISFAEVAMEAAYQAPTSVDLSTLQALVRSQLEAAQDHAWDLRQDPAYFSEVITEVMTHNEDYGHSTDLPKNIERDPEFVVSIGLMDCYVNVALWEEVDTLLHAVIVLREMLDPNIANKPSSEWPEHYVQAIFELGGSVIGNSLSLRRKLRHEVYYSPSLRHLWEETDARGLREKDVPFLVPKRANTKDYFPLLIAVLTTWKIHYVYPLHQITEQIGRLLETNTSLSQKITRLVGDRLSNIQVLEEVMRQLRQYCPELYCSGRACMRPDAHENTSLVMREGGSRGEDSWAICCAISFGNQLDQFAPRNGQFHYPADKPRSRQRVEQIQRAERRLDLLWSKIDESIGKTLNVESIGEKMPAMDFSDRTLQRTPDWVPAEAKKIDVDSPISIINAGFDSTLCHQEASPSKKFLTETRSTTKTRGTDTSDGKSTYQAQIQAVQEQVLPKQHLFHLKERDLKVFRNLFYQPSNEDAVGKIKFNDFLHAMSSVGFSYQKMGGSAWLFVPPAEWETRGISFHEPHGSMAPKVDFGKSKANDFGSGSAFAIKTPKENGSASRRSGPSSKRRDSGSPTNDTHGKNLFSQAVHANSSNSRLTPKASKESDLDAQTPKLRRTDTGGATLGAKGSDGEIESERGEDDAESRRSSRSGGSHSSRESDGSRESIGSRSRRPETRPRATKGHDKPTRLTKSALRSLHGEEGRHTRHADAVQIRRAKAKRTETDQEKQKMKKEKKKLRDDIRVDVDHGRGMLVRRGLYRDGTKPWQQRFGKLGDPHEDLLDMLKVRECYEKVKRNLWKFF